MHSRQKMKQTRHFTLIILFAALLFTLLPCRLLCSHLETEQRFGIEFPELSPISMPEIKEYKLKNDMVFLLCENHDFPTISVSVLIVGGSYYEEPDKLGMVDILADLLRTGGTDMYSPQDLNRILDDMAISLTTSGRIHSIAINMSFLSEDAPLAFDILNQVLRKPAFNEESFNRSKMSQNTQIARRNDNISAVTGREFVKLVFGEDNPYARTNEYETIANVTRDDLIDYHKTFFQPQNTLVSVVGSFQTKDMQRLLNKTFGNWKRGKIDLPEAEKFPVTYQSSINYIPREDAQQSWITIGHISEMTQRDPDYVPMLVLNSLLGGGFNSRIYQRIRNQLGLAYAPQAYYSVYFDFPGVFYLMSQTVADRTVTAIEALIDEIEKLQKEYITEEELEQAKESFLNSFVFNYDTPEAIVRRQLNYRFWDYPLDFLEQIRDRVADVTVEDINRLANQYLFPEHFIVLAVGNEKEFERPLNTLGEVNVIDISIPRPQQARSGPTPERIAQGEALFDRYIEKMGNVEKVENMKLEGVITEYRGDESSTSRFTVYIEFPDRITQMIHTPTGSLSMVYNRGAAKMAFPGREMALPPEFVDEIRNNMRSNPIALAQNYREMFNVYLVEEKRIDDKDFYILSFSDEYNQFLLFLDKETMLPYQTIQETVRPGIGLMTLYRIYEKYEEIDGVLYPVKTVTKDETGNLLTEDDFTNVKFNIDLPTDIFKVE